MSTTHIEDFNYNLPDDRIARHPVSPRHSSKLLVYQRGKISTDVYLNLPSYLPKESMLILNNSKVVQARLNFQKASGAMVEVFCLEHSEKYPDVQTAMQEKGSVEWICQIGGSKKWKNGPLKFPFQHLGKEQHLIAEQQDRLDDYFKVQFQWTDPELCFAEILHLVGDIPLPPYLKRSSEARDEVDYQTVYAKEPGSVAAPTAGLHFSEEMMQKLSTAAVATVELTLHVGAGTFKPVKSPTAEEHDMHAEFIEINIQALQKLIATPHVQRIAVGTTSLRTLESIYWMGVKLLQNPTTEWSELDLSQWEAYNLDQNVPFSEAITALIQKMHTSGTPQFYSKTSLMIKPGYRIRSVSAILTNFHQPKSTLLLLIHAFVGNDWKRIYDYALMHDFRFLSYGDGSLLWLDE